ncbi:recombinase family protein [Sphingomonas sp. PAMC 26605]|uniref:recombinase family protein n=1 Tax=Sphingomonas sp. PAMC 26605 TaxID=1112214 RepID=UPI00026CDE6E|nr:recombinase family protein [Sphingomonas sp. PAMC 26605]
MIYGYARVSSNGQDLAQQLAQLDAAGCTKVYREKISGATAERPQLKRAIGALDASDVLMVTSTDRLARNTRDLLNILHAVKEAGAGFRSIAEPMVDTTSQFADVIIAVLGVAASYERHRITERTAAGRVQAKARGVKFGRRAALTPHQQSEALQRLTAGDTQRTVAALLGVSQATISRLATPTAQRTMGVLSPSTEAWSQAALDAGNRADHDPEYANEIGKRLF